MSKDAVEPAAQQPQEWFAVVDVVNDEIRAFEPSLSVCRAVCRFHNKVSAYQKYRIRRATVTLGELVG